MSRSEVKEHLSFAAMLAYACSMCQQMQHMQMNVRHVHAGMDFELLILALTAHSKLVQSRLDKR
jgi:hypothetical protein